MKRLIMYLMIATVCFGIIFLTISLITNYTNIAEKAISAIKQTGFIKNDGNYETIEKHLKVFMSFLLANTIGIINLLYNRKDKNEDKKVNISICITEQSIEKKEPISNYKPCVEIGNGESFVYITTEIKNISECMIKTISCQNIIANNSVFEPKQKIKLYIKINKPETTRFNKKYIIKIFLLDMINKSYCSKVKLIYNTENRFFNISYSKSKRSIKHGKN